MALILRYFTKFVYDVVVKKGHDKLLNGWLHQKLQMLIKIFDFDWPVRMELSQSHFSLQSQMSITRKLNFFDVSTTRRFCFWRCLWRFGCVWNKLISGTAERICAKFPTEDVFGPSLGRVWRSRSKVKSPWTKNGIFRPFRRFACGSYLVKHL